MNTPFPILNKTSSSAIPIITVSSKQYAKWLKTQSATNKRWLEQNRFAADPGTFCLLPGKNGGVAQVVCGISDTPDLWSIAHLPAALPPEIYKLASPFDGELATQLTLGWALACYRFSRYKSGKAKRYAALVAPKGCHLPYVEAMTKSVNWARDLINTPAGDMNPAALATEASIWAKTAGASVTIIKGEELLKANYPTIYAVGKASSVPPHLVDIRFGGKGPKVTLVGKGVCFDSGGLDLKSSSNMKLMKKDMGGAAAVLALARTLVEEKLPIQLRVLLPIVENAVSGNAMRPLDIIKTRKGLTVEVGNTDAEGRLILCDALFEADQEKPDLIIDCATLTGAARVALGTEIPAFFTPDDQLAARLMMHSKAQNDPLWRLPLWRPYRSMLDTPAADLSNDPDSGYGGAITAALYLQEFVSKTPSWLHIDMMAWNVSAKPGRPQGGEAMAVRALHALIKERYGY